jgi:hypothetical protein
MTLATVTPIPGTARLISVADCTRTERMRNLAWLASRVIEAPHKWPLRIISDHLALYASPDLTPAEKALAFTDYVGARREERDALAGRLVWQDLTDEMGPQGHHMPVTEIAAINAATALATLAGRDTNGGN